MISAMLLGLSLAQKPSVDGAALISKMFAYYAASKSMDGTIHMVQTAENVSLHLDTAIAFESPSKLFIKQVLTTPDNSQKQWLVTSDGKSFTYDYPNQQRNASNGPEPNRLWEAVSPDPAHQQDFRQIFHAAVRSLGDVSIPELLAIAGRDELTTIKNQIVNITYAGDDTVDGQAVHVLTGDWRVDAASSVTGKYGLYITDDGQLKRFAETENVAVKLPGVDSKPQQIRTIWNVDLHRDAAPDEALFNVVK